MTLFFSLSVLLGLAQMGLVYITRTSPDDSWPDCFAVYNPFWGAGVVAIGIVGIACSTIAQ